MLKTVLENILKPAITRTGTMISGMLIGYGVSTDHANAIAIGGVSLVLVAIDFGFSWLSRKNIEREAKTEGVRQGVRSVMGTRNG